MSTTCRRDPHPRSMDDRARDPAKRPGIRSQHRSSRSGRGQISLQGVSPKGSKTWQVSPAVGFTLEVPEMPLVCSPPPPDMAAITVLPNAPRQSAKPEQRVALRCTGEVATPPLYEEEREAEDSASAPETLQHATEELGRRLCRRIDDMEESLAQAFERLLDAAFLRALGSNGEGPDVNSAKSITGMRSSSLSQRRVGSRPILKGLYESPQRGSMGLTSGFHHQAKQQLTPCTGCTWEAEGNDSGAKSSGERTKELLTPCSSSDANPLLGMARESSASAPARITELEGVPLPSAAPVQRSEPVSAPDVRFPTDAPAEPAEAADYADAHFKPRSAPVVFCSQASAVSNVLESSLDDGLGGDQDGGDNPFTPKRGRASCHSHRASVCSAEFMPRWSSKDVTGVESGDTSLRVRINDIRVSTAEMGEQSSPPDFNKDLDEMGQRQSLIRSNSRLQSMVMHPTSNPILVWHIIGPLLLAYDIITIPLKAFGLPEHWLFDAIAITITGYWSVDTVRGFFTGYETEHSVEMRPSAIAKRYIRTWFALDAITVALDWAFIIGGSGGMFNKFWRTTRAVQAWRVLRLVRLVRLVKFANRISATIDQVLNMQALLVIKSFYIFFAVCFFCHYMACYWYLMGDHFMEQDVLQSGGHTWLKEYKLEGAGLYTLYSTCFHWALAQSGYGVTNIIPTNNAERTYASIASFIWLVIVSVVINIFGMWLGQFHEANKDVELQRILLRRFLEEHEISRKLTYKVLRCFRTSFRAKRRRVHEEDCEFLRNLPLALKIALHKEVYVPILKSHIFFQFLGNIVESLPLMISHLGMTESHYLPNDTVFRENLPATHMLYVSCGHLDYYAVRMNMRQTKVGPGEWACEPALWLRWTLRGRLISVVSAELIGVDVEKFQAIIQDAQGRGVDVSAVRRFAVAVCEYFMDQGTESDLWRDFETIRHMADEVIIDTASCEES